MMGAADGPAGEAAPAGFFPGGTPYSGSEVNDLVTQNGPYKAISPDGATQGRTGSEISFHDTQGQEIAYFQAQKDANSVIKNAKTSVIGNTRACTVGTDDSLTIENSQEIHIGRDQTVTIGADRKWKIGGDVVQDVTHNYTLTTNDSIVNATDGRSIYYAQGKMLIHSDTEITLRVGASFITLKPDNITIQSGDRVDINPMQGTKEYQDKKAAEERAARRAAAQKKIADATGDEKKAYDAAKNFSDHRGDGDGQNTQRWNDFRTASYNANMDDQEVMNTYNTANNLDPQTSKPLP
jgi:type VI secretion system secreted protein VgrG